MESDGKEKRKSEPGGDKSWGNPKRPSRVIDLEAAEVEAGPQEKPGAEDTDAKDADSEDADSEDADNDAGPEGSEEKPPASRPPQRTKPSDVKGFVTHLAAGLAGGLIGVIGVGVALDRLAFEPPDTSPAIAQFGQRLEALDARLAGQARSSAAAGDVNETRSEAARETLAARLAALENKPAAAAADLQPLEARLAKLEDTLKTLAASGGDAGDGAAGAVRALEEHLAALEKKIGALASRPAAAASPQVNSGSGTAALTLTFASLRRAIDRGEPYGGALKRLQEIAPAGIGLSALSSHAGAGIGTDTALLIELAPALKAARAAADRSDDDTFLGRLAANARSMVRVRRIGPAAGGGAEAVLSRMEAHMKAGDLAGARKQTQDLSGPAMESLQPWLIRAKARHAVQGELEQLERRLLAGLQSGKQR